MNVLANNIAGQFQQTSSKSLTPVRFSPITTRVRRDFGHTKHLPASGVRGAHNPSKNLR
jgi:hypothetical protein